MPQRHIVVNVHEQFIIFFKRLSKPHVLVTIIQKNSSTGLDVTSTKFIRIFLLKKKSLSNFSSARDLCECDFMKKIYLESRRNIYFDL